jgi:soluble lytic murein transglycosylase-like protein
MLVPACFGSNITQWNGPIVSASHATGIPVSIIAAVMSVESSGQQSVVSTDGYGSIGLMQLLAPTAASVMRVSVGYAMTALYNPYWNVLAGANYLRENLAYGGTIAFAVAAYNGGPGNPQWGYEAKVTGRVCG